jgi:hypothetical protein
MKYYKVSPLIGLAGERDAKKLLSRETNWLHQKSPQSLRLFAPETFKELRQRAICHSIFPPSPQTQITE